MTDPAKDSAPPTRSKLLLTALVWGAVTFVVTFGAFWFLDRNGLTHALAAMLFPNAEVNVRYNDIIVILLTVPPIIISTIGGCIHRSWCVFSGIAFVYAIPIGVFLALVIPEWH